MPVSGEQIDVEVVVRCGCAVVTLSGDLDAATGLQFEAVVAGIVRVPGVARLEVDGRELQFVDSSGVYALLRARADALAAGVGVLSRAGIAGTPPDPRPDGRRHAS